MRSASSPFFSMTRVRQGTAALAVLFILLAVLGIPASAQRPNGAGVVVRHGDGTLIMAYVQFEGESISGNALLEQTGLQITAAPYGGLGTGICMIDHEGCGADNCYCESYDNPAEFWQYYSWDGAAWVLQPFGPSTRDIHDGDIDGWSWTGGEHGLPAVSIDEIASLNGVDRNPPTPTPTPPPPPTETPVPPTPTPVPPTATPEPTATQPPPPTAVEASPTPAPTSTPPPQPTDLPTATTAPMPSATPTALAQSPSATSPPTAEVASTLDPTESDEARAQASPSPTATATEAPTSVAVIITPGSTPQALVQESRDEDGSSNLLIFGLMAGVVVLVGGGIAGLRWRRQG